MDAKDPFAKPRPISYEEVTRPDFLATRGFDVFEKSQEYRTAVVDRMYRTAAALQRANVPYGIAGGNAIASWVATVDPAAVRATQDVDILLRRSDLDAAIAAMKQAGFIYHHAASLDFFTDGPQGRARDGVHIVFAGERVRPEYNIPAPTLEQVVLTKQGYYVVGLEAMVTMKLTSNRRKDQVHIDDLISVNLIDATWLDRVPAELAPRLKHLLDNPEE